MGRRMALRDLHMCRFPGSCVYCVVLCYMIEANSWGWADIVDNPLGRRWRKQFMTQMPPVGPLVLASPIFMHGRVVGRWNLSHNSEYIHNRLYNLGVYCLVGKWNAEEVEPSNLDFEGHLTGGL